MEIAARFPVKQPNSESTYYDFRYDAFEGVINNDNFVEDISFEIEHCEYIFNIEYSLALNWKIWFLFNQGNRLKAHKAIFLWKRIDQETRNRLKGKTLKDYELLMEQFALQPPILK